MKRLKDELARLLEHAGPGEHKIELRLPAVPGTTTPARAVEVTITIRRAASGVEAGQLREAATALLMRQPWLADRCACETQRKGWLGKGRCSKVPSVAVEFVGDTWSRAEPVEQTFAFVCSSHTKNYRDRRTVSIPVEVIKKARWAALRGREDARRQQVCVCGVDIEDHRYGMGCNVPISVAGLEALRRAGS